MYTSRVFRHSNREKSMSSTAIADGKIGQVQEAAQFAVEVQDACNLYAIANAWLGHLKALREAGAHGDLLNNHPVVLAFVSTLNSLCRLNLARELASHDLCDKLASGEAVEYEIISL
jgi:hypothetical protein